MLLTDSSRQNLKTPAKANKVVAANVVVKKWISFLSKLELSKQLLI